MSETEGVNQKSAKHWLSNVIWLVVFTGVAFGVLKAVSQEDVLPIREISITGEFKQIAEKDLYALVMDGVGGNFFTFDVEAIYKKFYTMPWVEKIWVHRVWPDKINIELREHKAVAILKDKGLLNDKGQVFISDAQQFEKQLPVFVIASQYEQQAIKAYRAYKEMLQQAGLTIKRFNFDGRKSKIIFRKRFRTEARTN